MSFRSRSRAFAFSLGAFLLLVLPTSPARADSAGNWTPAGSLGTARRNATYTALPNGKILIVGGVNTTGVDFSGSVFFSSAEIYDPTTGAFTDTGSLTSGSRALHTATLLPDGNVLVVGGWNESGSLATAEIYDTNLGTFQSTGGLGFPRSEHTATLLPNGTVVVIGGRGPLDSAEIYDPQTGGFTFLSAFLAVARTLHTATLLPNGDVLVAGGFPPFGATGTLELFRPATSSFSTVGSGAPRGAHTATLLPNGKVLLAGGNAGLAPTGSADLYDSVTGTVITLGATMGTARQWHGAVLLPSGRVLLVGGNNNPSRSFDIQTSFLTSVELFDPATNSFGATTAMGSARSMTQAVRLWTGDVLMAGGGPNSAETYCPVMPGPFGTFATGSLNTARVLHTATLLPNGKVLIAGGAPSTGIPPSLNTAELYDPATGTYMPTSSMNVARAGHTATLLPNGKVLIAGGHNMPDFPSYAIGSAELYDPMTGTFSPTGSMDTARTYAAATLLGNGKVLIVSGLNYFGNPASAELYDPASASFTLIGPTSGRYGHTVTRLGDGRVLIAGGRSAFSGTGFNSAEIYDPTIGANGTFLGTGSLGTGRTAHVATLLPNGQVLIAGGVSDSSVFSSAELYDPASGSFSPKGPMSTARYDQTAVLLPTGEALVVGGADPSGNSTTLAELYDVTTGTFSTTSPLTIGLGLPTATLLPNGKVLIAGGFDTNGNALGDSDLYVTSICQASASDLKVLLTAPTTAVTGDLLSYGVVVNNNGPDAATGVVLTLTTPAGTTVGGSMPSFCSTSGNVVTCNVGAMNSGGTSVSFTIQASVTAFSGTLTATAVVSAAATDPNLNDNTATASTTVTALGSINGRVTKVDGTTGIDGVTVSTQGPSFRSATTIDGGYYTITGVTPGSYFVQAQATGYPVTWYNGKPTNNADTVVVTGGATTANIDFRLGGLVGSISGIVTDGTSPLADVEVQIHRSGPGGGYVTSVRTRSDAGFVGSYTTGPVLPPGPYMVMGVKDSYVRQFYNNAYSFNTANAVNVTSGSDISGINLTLAPGAGGLSGTVTAVGTGAPLNGIHLDFYDSAGGVAGSAMTRPDGTYSSSNTLQPGPYRVLAHGAGVEPQFYSGKTDLNSADVVTVPGGGSGVANFVMTTGAVISGTVTRLDNGQPVAFAVVEVFDPNNASVDGVTTDANGQYTTNGLRGGSYKVRARGAAGLAPTFFGGGTTFNTAMMIFVASGGTATADISMVAGHAIKGVVRDTGLIPLTGAAINVYDASNVLVDGPFFSASDGSYDTGGRFAPGSYKVSAALGGYATRFYNNARGFNTSTPVQVGATDVININFSLPVGAGISGTVTSTLGMPIKGAIVDLFDPNNGAFLLGGFGPTDENGFYNTGAVLNGGYKVKARVPPPASLLDPTSFIETFHGSPGIDITTATTVTVIGADVSSKNIALPPGGTIRGRVVDFVSRQPIPSAAVIAGRVAANNFFGTFSVPTDTDGNFAIRGLRDGEWTLRVVAPGHVIGYYAGPSIEDGRLVPDGNTAWPISIGGANVAYVGDLGPRAGGGTLTGTITRADSGAVVVNANVSVNGTSPRLFSTGFVMGATTDANGTYTIRGLPDGKYVVQAGGLQALGGTAIGFYPGIDAQSFSSAVPVTVTSGVTTTASFAIPGFPSSGPGPTSPRQISGTVRDALGNPVSFAIVQAIRPLTNGFVRSVAVNGNGTYTLNLLTPGRYLIRVFTETGYQVQIYNGQHQVNAGEEVDVTAANLVNKDFALSSTAPGLVSGFVSDGAGIAIVGANVQVRNFLDSSAAVFGASTRADGTFLVRGVPPGFYKVRVHAEGFVTDHYRQPGPSARSFGDASWVPVPSGVNTTLDIGLEPGGAVVTGTVASQQIPPPAPPAPPTRPLGEAVVQFRDPATNSTVMNLISAADGTYAAPGVLAPGNYQIAVFAVGHATQWAFGHGNQGQADTIEVVAAGTAVPDIMMSTFQGSASGRIFLIDGATPLADAGVIVFDPTTGGAVRRSTTTDTQGRFRVPGLAPGTYTAQAQSLGFAPQFLGGATNVAAASTFVVAASIDTPNIDFALTQSSGISGTVQYAGPQTGPLIVDLFTDSDFTARAYRLVVTAPVFPQFYNFMLPPPDTQGILPGTYYVQAFIDSAPGGTRDATEAVGVFATSVMVAEEDTAFGIDITLTDPTSTFADVSIAKSVFPTGSVLLGGQLTYTLTVSNAGPNTATSVTVTDTLPLETTYVSATPSQGTCTPFPGDTGGSVTCALGTLANGTSATVTLVVATVTAGTVTNTATVTTTTTDPNTANNAASVSGEVVASGFIAGTVFDASTGGVIADATVDVYDSKLQLVRSTTTGPDGRYNSGPLVADAYRVSAQLDGFATTFYNGKHSLPAGDLVTVSAGTTQTADITLALGGGLSGRVVAGDTGQGLGGVLLNVFGPSSFSFTTTTDGYWTTGKSLLTGSYKVGVSTVPPYSNQFFNNAPTINTGAFVSVTTGAILGGIDFTLPIGGDLSGQVTRSDTSAPLAGATVQIYDATVGINNGVVRTIPTDGLGNYSTVGSGAPLAPGQYGVRAQAAGFLDKFYANGVDVFSATRVTVTAGGMASGVDISLAAAGTLSGTIRDLNTEQPIGAANVFLQRFIGRAFSGATFTQTNALGQFQFTGLADGEWLVRAEAAGHSVGWYSGDPTSPATDNGSATPIPIAGAATVGGIDVNLRPGGGLITGRVTRVGGGGVSTFVSASVGDGALYPRGGFVTGTTADASGNFFIGGLPPGKYVISANPIQAPNGTAVGWFPTAATSFQSALPVSVGAGAPVSGINFSVLGASGGAFPRSISGTVRDKDGTPIRFGIVQAVDPGFNSVSVTTSLNGDGSYTIPGLNPGRYYVRAQTETTFENRLFPDETVVSAGTLVDVRSESQTGIDLALPATAGTIQGQVSTRSNPADPESPLVPVAGAAIGVRNFLEANVGGTTTRQDGSFVVRGLAAGDYKVRMQNAAGFAIRFYTSDGVGAANFDGGSFVPVSAGGATTSVNIVVAPAVGGITGQVIEQGTGAPVSGVAVQLRDGATNAIVGYAVTRYDGTYAANNLADGGYKLRLAPLGFAAQYSFGQSTIDQAQVVTVNSTVSNANFTLARSEAAIAGQVSDSNGTVLRNVGVLAYDTSRFGPGSLTSQQDGFVIGSSISDSLGRFLLDRLPPGTYVLQARALGHARVFFGQVPDVARAQGFAITVTSPPDPYASPANITLKRTADVRGTINYTGAQTGPLSVGVFCDTALTQQIYGLTFPSPTFPQAYQFSMSPPDTRGLLPAAGTCPGSYYVGAFIDNNGNGAQDLVEPQGAYGGTITPNPVVLLEGTFVTGADITLAESAGAGGTSTQALAVPQTIVPEGGTIATLGNVVITENAPSALSTAGRIQATLPAGLTFALTPSVSTGASYGLSVVQSGPDAPRLELGGQRFSFALGSRSHGSGGSLVISGMLATVPAGFVGGSPVMVALGLDASASNGLTGTAPAVATLVPPPPDVVFTGIALNTDDAALGVTRTVILNGFNFNQLNFAAGDSVDFGTGITVIGTPVISADGTQVTVQVHVDPAAALGNRAVAIVHGGTRITAPGNGGQFTIDPLPMVTSAGTSLDPNTGQAVGTISASQTTQTIYIVGQNFVSPASPQEFVVQIGGTDITVDPNSLVYQSPTTVSIEALVASTAVLATRSVTVRNPDFGMSAPVSVLTVAAPQPDEPQGLGASKTQGTSTPPPAPTITNMSPAQAPTGTTVTVFGSNFVNGSTIATFTGPNGSKITASPSGAVSTGSFPVAVPATAITGPVSVTANNVVSAGTFAFTVNNPRPSGLTPNSAIQGTTVTVDLTGANFQNGMRVTVSGFAEVPTTFIDSTHVRFNVTVPLSATLGFRDVTARNTTDGGTGTLASAFQVNLASATTMTLVLKNLDGTLINAPTWLPSVDGVQVTLDVTGRCTAKTVTPTSIIVEAQLAGTSLPATLTYTITPSAIPGTAINEDCEIDPNTGLPTTTPTKDYTIGLAGSPPSLTAPLSVTVPVVAGVAQAQLAAWDWGGKVLISVTDNAGSPTVAGTLGIPFDGDGDDLPDIYESNGVGGVDNTDANGVNVLDPTRGDQDANGVLDRNDRFARDGLTNFEKYRGPYLQGPLNGTSGPMANHIRLGAGKRNLFVRARGFSSDPAIVAQPGTCGIDNSGNPVAQAADFLAAFPCPYFEAGGAFTTIGVKVWDVAASFTATSVFPTRSYVTVTTPTLDMATVTLDAVNCAGGQACDHAGKTGIRQWQFPTLGYSTFGSGTTFGDARVFLRAMRAYFTDKPYKHQENLAGTFLAAAPGTKPMLAPVTIVCDSQGGGSDNGVADLGECTDGTTLGGDVFQPGVFTSDMSAMDVNNDNCVELPFATDPTLLTPCAPHAASATFPQATFQQVGRSISTHELGHAVGINVHTADPTDLMYQYSTDWIRDGHFSPAAASLVQIHNKGLQ